MYMPTTGRFNKLDPFLGDFKNPQSLHKYGYVHGDPVNHVDPTGEVIGVVGGLVGLMAGGLISANARAASDGVALSTGSSIAARLAFIALRYGAPAVGLVGGYGVAAWQVGQALGPGPLWRGVGSLPSRGDNVSIHQWTDSIATILKEHVSTTPGLTPHQVNDGHLGAERLAAGYVKAVQKRAISVFHVQDHSDVLFGKNGGWAGWWGNLFDSGGECDCEHWTMDIYDSLKSTGVDGGWKMRGHFGTLKAGDLSLGVFFKHNFASVTFDPNGMGREPAFILDPWARARPDVFDFRDFNRHWPIDSGFEWEPIGG